MAAPCLQNARLFELQRDGRSVQLLGRRELPVREAQPAQLRPRGRGGGARRVLLHGSLEDVGGDEVVNRHVVRIRRQEREVARERRVRREGGADLAHDGVQRMRDRRPARRQRAHKRQPADLDAFAREIELVTWQVQRRQACRPHAHLDFDRLIPVAQHDVPRGSQPRAQLGPQARGEQGLTNLWLVAVAERQPACGAIAEDPQVLHVAVPW